MIPMEAALFEIGLVIGWIGGICIPGRRVLPVVQTVGVGIAAALAGGILAHALFGGGFTAIRAGLATAVTLLLVGGFTLHERERRLPR